MELKKESKKVKFAPKPKPDLKSKSNSKRSALYIVCAALPVVLGITYWWIAPAQDWTCHSDLTDNKARICKLKCPPNYFSVPWMDDCQPWLKCQEIESTDFKIIKHIGNGAVKMVYLVEWKGYKFALNTLLNAKFKEDFAHGLKMLVALQGSPHVTQLVGYCRQSYVTEYHQLGSADKLASILDGEESLVREHVNMKSMLGMCASYAEVLRYLHNSSAGTRVMCDSNDLKKTLNQFLVTSDLRLIANDLDALPQVNKMAKKLIKCGHRPLHGDFVAPEQVWNHEDLAFHDDLMQPYDEKTDIWKIPNVCEHFLDLAQDSEPVKFHLFKIHKECKSLNPAERPTAEEVLEKYKTLLMDIEN